MPKTITIICEDADGEINKPTGYHVDHGDGTATWITGAALDAVKVGPKTLRESLKRLRDDSAPLAKSVPKPRKEAPRAQEFIDGEKP